jgi:hypothetical protein
MVPLYFNVWEKVRARRPANGKKLINILHTELEKLTEQEKTVATVLKLF